MCKSLVCDRLLYRGPDDWLDIATGERHAAPDVSALRADAHERPAIADLVDRIGRAADAHDATGVRVMHLTLPMIAPRVVVAEAARGLSALGFVAVWAPAELPDGIRRVLMHRHLVLFSPEVAWDRAADARVRAWIRELTAASTRAHLLVILRHVHRGAVRPSAARGAAIVREHALALVPEPAERPADWSWRCLCESDAARTAILNGDLREAEATLQMLAAEAAIGHQELSDDVWRVRAELYFWQGRLHEADACVAKLRDDDADAACWRTLIRWAGGVCTLETVGANVSGRLAYLRAALAAERRLSAGDEDGARRDIRARRSSAPAPGRLERMVLDRLEDLCATDRPARASAVRAFVARSGAHGVWRWGRGGTAMNLIHGVSTLLEVVQDAADEYSALKRGCSWVRDQGRAEAAGIVADDGTRLIAGDAVETPELSDPDLRAAVAGGRGRTVANGPNAIVAAPVRYGGSTIGFAVVRGRSDAAEALAGAAKALASVCAPALRARLDALALRAASESRLPEILGRSPAIAALRESTARAATAPFPVLIEGESGTGKELVARAVHRLSPRRDRRFAALNCAALTDDLLEAELFGHTRGAFTGAVNPRAGLFEESHGSTLFLDEVAELSPRAQAKLLRVLQEREVRRLGEHLPRPVDVRVVAATNMPLAQAVCAGRFREDLLFRLAVIRLRVPPLRDRIEDVPLLAQAFWRTATAEAGKQVLLAADAVAALCRHHWPGNVRELQNVIAGLIVTAPARGRVGARQVAHVLASAGSATVVECDTTLEDARQALDRRMIAAALARHSGRCSTAARDLGLSRQGLVKAMKRLGLDGRTFKVQTANFKVQT
jgi:transcriptional regulator with GAF, ATPase, and Fis domain